MERHFKRALSFLIAAAVLTVSFCIAVSTPVYASSDKGLSRSSAVLKTGSTVRLTVKKPASKVKWKTSDKNIAYVKTVKGKKKQTAVIKAGKYAGDCTITATVGKKKLKCRITTEVRLSSSTKDLSSAIKAGKADRFKANSRFSSSAADFSFELLRKTVAVDSEKGKSENTLISPDSVLTALVMAENGAKGQTLSEMQDALSGGISVADYNRYLSGMNHRLTSSKNVRFHVANSIWTRSGGIKTRKSFLKKNKTYHNAKVFRAPFNDVTVKDMNKWVSGNTRGMIKQIISNLTADDQVVLINAIAFEGGWEEKFAEPHKETFTRENGEAVEAEMLHQRDRMDYLTVNGGKGFVKYYRGRDIAFVGVLPPEEIKADEFLGGLTGADFISAWNSKGIRLLDVSVPQFKYDYSASMTDPLKRMGMLKAFSTDADFTGMVVPAETIPGVHIDDVLHKTHIELDRNGTKAAAATAVLMKASSVMHEEEAVEVHLDRPFIYALVDVDTGIPLFTGILREVKN